MPAIKKTKTKGFRYRPYQKKKYDNYKLVAPRINRVFAQPGVGIGTSSDTVLRTCGFVNLTPSVAGIYTGYLNPSSCFSPFGTLAGGLQPTLYDKWVQLYTKYTVKKSWCKLEFATQNTSGAGNNYTFVVAAYPTTDPLIATNWEDAAGQMYAKSILAAAGDNTTSNTLKFSLDHRKFIGRLGGLDPSVNGALTSTSPTQPVLLQLFVQRAVANADPVIVKITMYQTVHFENRIPVEDV